MKFEIKKNVLLNKIFLVSLTSSKISELSNYIFLEVKKNFLELYSFDLEINIKTTVDVEVKNCGSVVIPSKKITEILKILPNETIILQQKNESVLEIICGKILYKLFTIDTQNFPNYPEISLESCFFLPCQIFQEILLKTQYAMSTESVRYVLHGLFLKAKGGKLTAVSTDGHRLALCECNLQELANFEAIIPYKTVLELTRILKEQQTIKIGKSGNQLIFNVEDTQIISRCIEANYPDYEQVIPKDSLDCKYVELEVGSLLFACQRVAVMAPERAAMMKMNFNHDSLLLSASTPSVGEAHESIPINYNSDPIELIINPRYVIEALKVLDPTEKVTITLRDPQSAIKLTANNYNSVIMPMRL